MTLGPVGFDIKNMILEKCVPEKKVIMFVEK